MTEHYITVIDRTNSRAGDILIACRCGWFEYTIDGTAGVKALWFNHREENG